jgi:hypothetical protein
VNFCILLVDLKKTMCPAGGGQGLCVTKFKLSRHAQILYVTTFSFKD